MTDGFVGLDTDGLRSLADLLDRQADRVDDLAADARRALLISELPGDGLLPPLVSIADRDRAAAAELRRRLDLAERFRLDLTVTTVDLVSATDDGRVLRDELDRIEAAIGAWVGTDNDPGLDGLIAWRRTLLTEVAGGDRAVAAQLSRLMDRGASLDEVLIHLAAWRVDEQIAAIRAGGLSETEAVRRLDTELWISARTVDLVDDGVEPLAARQQASFENDVATAIASGYSPHVAQTLIASLYAEADLPVPPGVKALDPQQLVDRFFGELDVARDLSRGDRGEADGFTSFDDLHAVVDPANAHLFSPDAILTANVALELARHDEDFAEQFLGDGLVDWFVRHRDEVVRGLAVVGGIALAIASGGTLSPLGVVLAGLAVSAGAALTTVGINALSDNYDLWDNVTDNAASGFAIGMAAAGLASAARLALAARTAGRPIGTHVIAATGEAATATAEGGFDVVLPDGWEAPIHSAAGATANAVGMYQLGQRISSTQHAIESRADEVSTVYRVQGGVPPAASRDRIAIGEAGEMLIDDPDSVLYVTFDDVGRARAFVKNNRPGARIIAFDVDPEFAAEIRRVAVPQHQARRFPDLPHMADATKTDSSFGLPSEWIERLTESAMIGTGRILE